VFPAGGLAPLIISKISSKYKGFASAKATKFFMLSIKVEHQYQIYLKRMSLSEETMHPEQKLQIKNTFFGAFGQLLLLMRDEITELEEDDAVKVLGELLNQVVNHFLAINKN